MDGYNNQRNVFYSWPLTSQQPCMNTNCQFSYNSLPPMNPISGNRMMSDQMMADRVSISCCGRGEVSGRSEMSMWEPRREAREEARGEGRVGVRGRVKSEMRCAPGCEAKCEPKREVNSEVKSEIEMENEVFPAMMTGCDDMPIGMAYVPWQRWGTTYPIDQGLNRGTIFPDLDLPFEMGRCR